MTEDQIQRTVAFKGLKKKRERNKITFKCDILRHLLFWSWHGTWLSLS